MSFHLSNPAGRLWLTFNETAVKYPDDWTFGRTVRDYLGLVEDGPAVDFMKFATEIWDLTVQAEAAVRELSEQELPSEGVLRALERIRGTLTADPVGNQPNSWIVNSIGGAQTMTELKWCSHALRGHQPQAVIHDDTISRIKYLADEIVNLATADASLDPAAREQIIRYAARLSRAAALYKVTGSQPLVDELDRLQGITRRCGVQRDTPLWRKMLELGGAIVIAVDLALVPVNAAIATDYYGDMLALEQSVEAPGPRVDEDIIDAEVVIESDKPDEPAAAEQL